MRGGVRAVLRQYPELRLYVAARLVSEIGTWLAYVALTVDILARTHAAGWVAAVLGAGLVPSVAVGLGLGPVVDRLPRKLLLVGAELTGGLVFLALPFAHAPAVIVALAAVAGFCAAIFHPASAAALPNLVAEEDLEQANALAQTLATLGVTLGPIAAGGLVTAAGPGAGYLANAASFLVSAALFSRIPRRKLQVATALGGSHLAEVLRGFRQFAADRVLGSTLVAATIVGAAAAAANVGEILIAKQSLHAGTLGFSLLATATGVGLVSSSAVSGHVLRGRSLPHAFAVALVATAAGVGAVAVAQSLPVAVAGAFVGAAGNGIVIACIRLLVQRHTSDELRGRAFTVLYGLADGAGIAGMVAAGALGATLGPRAIWAAAAAAIATAAVTAWAGTLTAPAAVAAE